MPNILATKLRQPSPPPNTVSRPRLVQRLNEGLAAGRRLTLISAPAGFGKTTCAVEWLDGLDRPVAWLSLERADDDPRRFFAYLMAALRQVDEGIGREIESVFQSGQPAKGDHIGDALVNDILNASVPFILALDDFHAIQEPAILDVLSRLINNQPPEMHLVLITREDPLLHLARLRANDQMTEIRGADLRFSAGETGRFLNEALELSLSAEEIAALNRRTEGWIAGLQLAGLSMRGRADPARFIANLSGTNRFILSYLTEEVLSGQPQEVQDFLLQTAVLDRLSGELCDAVTGRTGSDLMLEGLFQANLFLIPLDDEQRWYRYHHLFADLLRNQQRRLPKEQINELHRRASRWYAGAGMPGEAIEHALAGEDYRQAVGLLERHARPMVMQGYVKTVEGWMQAIPPEWATQSPRANLSFAWMHLLRGSYGRTGPYLEQVEAALAPADPSAASPAAGPDAETRALRSEWYALLSVLRHVQGRPTEGVEMAERALEMAAPEARFVRGAAYLGLAGARRELGDYTGAVEAYLQAIQSSRAGGILASDMLAVSALTLMAIQHGQLRFAVEVGRQAIDHLERSGGPPPPVAGSVYGALGAVYYEWGQIEKAREHFARAGQLCTLGGHTAGITYTQTLMARLLTAEGDLPGAAQAIQEAAALLQLGAPAWLRPEVISQQVRVDLARHNPAAAEAALQPFGPVSLEGAPPQGFRPFEMVYLSALRLRLFRAQEQGRMEDLPEAVELAGSLIDEAAEGGRQAIRIQSLLLRAQMKAVLGDEQAAVKDVCQALELGEAEGYLRAFVDEGPNMAELLRRCLAQGVRPDYVERILANFSFAAGQGAAAAVPGSGAAHDGDGRPEAPAAEALVEPLTERELEVLRLMAAGLKYEEISGRLVISLNTVRYHVKGIYGKLYANNRTKAIETARRLGML